ncbi:MAG: hypothetical protein QXW41_09455 [Fervidicoccaceae archaeon]
MPGGGGWFWERYIIIGPGIVIVERKPYSLPVRPPPFDNASVEMPRSTLGVDARELTDVRPVAVRVIERSGGGGVLRIGRSRL